MFMYNAHSFLLQLYMLEGMYDVKLENKHEHRGICSQNHISVHLSFKVRWPGSSWSVEMFSDMVSIHFHGG